MLQRETRLVDVREVVPCEAAREGETGLVVFEMDDVHAGMGDGESAPEEMRRDAQQIERRHDQPALFGEESADKEGLRNAYKGADGFDEETGQNDGRYQNKISGTA